ncbi:uncharacterized protein LOC128553555 [Mercenaria mercenaria]|uniref:uncharacterized protein LOC128553555 n=1 Tax=Mercenaria mercenaria TaxID=6596 RepID=UPI00234EB7EB|nr:uncharacterized protein LOC128553555 [Mercenaria mercenaria]
MGTKEDGTSEIKEEAGATGISGISEEDEKLLKAFHSLHVKPTIETPEDLISFMKKYGTLKSKTLGTEVDIKTTTETSTTEPTHEMGATGGATASGHDTYIKTASYHFPKISTFGGDSGKGDVTWECFKFEVEALLADGVFTQEQILHGIRRSVKGEVAEIIRRLGIDATIHQILDKLDSTYGNIETTESIMRKFYNCTQQQQESVTSFASRLENYLTKQFKIEIRKIEADTKDEGDEKKKPCKPAVIQPEKNDMTEVKDLLKKLNERVHKLEEQKNNNEETFLERGAQYRPYNSRGTRWNGSNRGFTRYNNRGYNNRGNRGGRGDYTPSRPTANTTFSPTCYRCNKRGHYQYNCPNYAGSNPCTSDSTKDPKLVGDVNEVNISVNKIGVSALLDTGSCVSLISESFYKEHLSDVELEPLTGVLNIECAD